MIPTTFSSIFQCPDGYVLDVQCAEDAKRAARDAVNQAKERADAAQIANVQQLNDELQAINDNIPELSDEPDPPTPESDAEYAAWVEALRVAHLQRIAAYQAAEARSQAIKDQYDTDYKQIWDNFVRDVAACCRLVAQRPRELDNENDRPRDKDSH